jgi:hypothetical protein
MSKYDSLKYWKRTKARISHICQRCGVLVGKGEFYYKERIDYVNPPPSLILGELCERCAEETEIVVKN